MHPFHKEILREIKHHAGKAKQDDFLEDYLGNDHPKYAISAPTLRSIARMWFKAHPELGADQFEQMLTSLTEGKSFTEKVFAGILLDYTKAHHQVLKLSSFEHWLDHLQGWAEIDALCTGKYTQKVIPRDIEKWTPFLRKLSKSKNIGKRRASLVFLCSPISHSSDSALASIAFENIEKLKHEKDILITKAISWLLRSMIRHHREAVEEYLVDSGATLPKIAVRETKIKLDTGKKTSKRRPSLH